MRLFCSNQKSNVLDNCSSLTERDKIVNVLSFLQLRKPSQYLSTESVHFSLGMSPYLAIFCIKTKKTYLISFYTSTSIEHILMSFNFKLNSSPIHGISSYIAFLHSSNKYDQKSEKKECFKSRSVG